MTTPLFKRVTDITIASYLSDPKRVRFLAKKYRKEFEKGTPGYKLFSLVFTCKNPVSVIRSAWNVYGL